MSKEAFSPPRAERNLHEHSPGTPCKPEASEGLLELQANIFDNIAANNIGAVRAELTYQIHVLNTYVNGKSPLEAAIDIMEVHGRGMYDAVRPFYDARMHEREHIENAVLSNAINEENGDLVIILITNGAHVPHNFRDLLDEDMDIDFITYIHNVYAQQHGITHDAEWGEDSDGDYADHEPVYEAVGAGAGAGAGAAAGAAAGAGTGEDVAAYGAVAPGFTLPVGNDGYVAGAGAGAAAGAGTGEDVAAYGAVAPGFTLPGSNDGYVAGAGSGAIAEGGASCDSSVGHSADSTDGFTGSAALAAALEDRSGEWDASSVYSDAGAGAGAGMGGAFTPVSTVSGNYSADASTEDGYVTPDYSEYTTGSYSPVPCMGAGAAAGASVDDTEMN